MSKIRIVNWLLTRRCNLDCDYCAIVKDYDGMPYPKMSHYKKHEMSTETIINALSNFKKHNPGIFHIFYGGEPLLRKDLPDIINYCNDNQIHYTIISNNTRGIQRHIKRLFEETDYISGFTSSVDPIFNSKMDNRKDRIRKSVEGMKRLKEIQARGDVKDVVAEITVMNENKHLLLELVGELSENEIYSDITFVDIAKSLYYDFSNVSSPDLLVKPTLELAQTFLTMLNDDSLLIHMKDILLNMMFDILPSNFDCLINTNLHTICIDSDSTLRLCLRIRGINTPKITVDKLFYDNEISEEILPLIDQDKTQFCKLCNHSCYMMGLLTDTEEKNVNGLIHFDKRNI
jgi:MoaA/NifB/PqqE/SkfB family radical SAM enzyme